MTDEQVILKSLRMENFGCFDDHEVAFAPGLNQIIGPNESGKSTIIKALFTVLFEDGNTRKRMVAALTNWTRKKSFRLTLKFSLDEKEFTLIRDHGDGCDIMTDSDGITYEGKAITEKLALYFGTGDRNLFESVFCFSADAPTSLERQRDKLKSALERPLFSGFDRIRADKYLEEEIKKLDNPRAHGPRELDIIDDRIKQYLQEKTRLEDRLRILGKDHAELDEAQATVLKFEDDIAELEKSVTGGEAYQRLDSQMAGLEERLQTHLASYSRAAQASDDLERLEHEAGDIQVPTDEKFDHITETRDRLAEAVDESKRIMDDILSQRRRANRSFLAMTLMLVLICLGYVFQLNGYVDFGPATEILPYSIPVLTLFWLIWLGTYLTQGRKKKTATIIFRENVASLDAFYAGLNETYHLQAADPIKAISEAGTRKEALEISIDNLRGTINLFSDGKGLSHLENTKVELEAEVSQINKELTPLVEFASAAGKIAELKEELTAKRVRCNVLRERAALLTERCTAIEPLTLNIEVIDEELEILKRQHKDITERLEILKITRAALNRAADSLITQTFTLYGKDASFHLSSLTDGRHSRLRFAEETHTFEIQIGPDGGWRQVGPYLSSSTRDAVYLALRLAAMDRLSHGFSAPAVFDQADSRMDENRRHSYGELLAALAKNRQVIHIAVRRSDSFHESHLIECEAISTEAKNRASSG